MHGSNAVRVAKITMARPKRKKVRTGLLPGPLVLRLRRFLLFVASNRLPTTMKLPTFHEWLARRDEGLLLPDRLPAKGMIRINTFPTTDTHRKKLHPKPPKKPKPFAPTVRAVKEIVPNKLIPKSKPMLPRPQLH